MRPRYIVVLVALVILCGSSTLHAKVSLPDVVSNGMVLQQGQKVPIWGKADPGEAITITFAGQKKQTVADKDGKWLVRLNPLHVNSTPATMSIEGHNKIELADILVG